jgi:hypothetical protein
VPYCSTERKQQGFEEEIEFQTNIDDVEVTEDGFHLSGTVEMTRNCAGCGQGISTATLEIDESVDHHCPKGTKGIDDREGELSDFEDPEMVDEYETKDRRGKPIKSARFQKHLIGASLSGSIKCSACGEEIDVSWEDKIPASEFQTETSH